MPLGILVIRWDNEIGPINEGFCPKSLIITNNLLTQVYSSHRYQSLKPGFASISLKNNKVISFFSGVGDDFISIENYVVALLLRRDEAFKDYLSLLKKIAAELLNNISENSIDLGDDEEVIDLSDKVREFLKEIATKLRDKFRDFNFKKDYFNYDMDLGGFI